MIFPDALYDYLKTPLTSGWDRLRLVCEFANSSPLVLAYELAIPDPQRILEVRENGRISSALAKRITDRYPIFSYRWLRSGSGPVGFGGHEDLMCALWRAGSPQYRYRREPLPPRLGPLLHDEGWSVDIVATLLGSWKMMRLYDKPYTGGWVPVSEYDPTDSSKAYELVFEHNGGLICYEGNAGGRPGSYFFDPTSGILRLRCGSSRREKQVWMLKLTYSRMEWLEDDGEGFIRCIFIREW